MTDFPYTTGIPAGPHNPSADQPIMQTNTNSINSILGVDHFTFNDSNGGWHQQSTYVTTATPPVTTSSQLALFNTTGLELHMIRNGDPATETSLTTSKIGAPIAANNGVSYIPGPSIASGGGILIQWGQVPNPGTSGTVFFTTPFPSGNPPFNIQLTLERSSGNQTVTVSNSPAPSSAGFTYLSSSAGSNILYWMAIGN